MVRIVDGPPAEFKRDTRDTVADPDARLKTEAAIARQKFTVKT
jgi:hypothetical protein